MEFDEDERSRVIWLTQKREKVFFDFAVISGRGIVSNLADVVLIRQMFADAFNENVVATAVNF